MAQPVPITLDKERTIKLTHNALAEASEVAPNGVERVLSGHIDFAGIRAFLWAGLRVEEPTLTIRQVSDLMESYTDNGGDYRDLQSAVLRAIELSGLVPKKKPDGEQGNGTPEAGTPTSGPGSQNQES